MPPMKFLVVVPLLYKDFLVPILLMFPKIRNIFILHNIFRITMVLPLVCKRPHPRISPAPLLMVQCRENILMNSPRNSNPLNHHSLVHLIHDGNIHHRIFKVVPQKVGQVIAFFIILIIILAPHHKWIGVADNSLSLSSVTIHFHESLEVDLKQIVTVTPLHIMIDVWVGEGVKEEKAGIREIGIGTEIEMAGVEVNENDHPNIMLHLGMVSLWQSGQKMIVNVTQVPQANRTTIEEKRAQGNDVDRKSVV